jgi:hypothetical protein
MDSLQVTDQAAAVHATHPRVMLADIEAAISQKFFLTGYDAAKASDSLSSPVDELKTLTLCVLVMDNGFTVLGKSAPASPQNFNAELGRRFAYEDAVRQLWPLMGFALRDKLAGM